MIKIMIKIMIKKINLSSYDRNTNQNVHASLMLSSHKLSAQAHNHTSSESKTEAGVSFSEKLTRRHKCVNGR